MSRPVLGAIDVTVHDRRGRPEPDAMGRLHHLQPLPGRQLVGTELPSDVVVQNLGGRARQGPQPGGIELLEILLEREVEGRRALPHFQR